jgi:transposase
MLIEGETRLVFVTKVGMSSKVMSQRSAVDNYEARITSARVRYQQACEDLESSSAPNPTAAEAIAFATLQSAQQAAMRELVASELHRLTELREQLAKQLPPDSPMVAFNSAMAVGIGRPAAP